MKLFSVSWYLCRGLAIVDVICVLLLQGFYYDAFYGDLGLNDNHFPNIEAGAAKAAKVLVFSLVC